MEIILEGISITEVSEIIQLLTNYRKNCLKPLPLILEYS